MKSMIFLDSRIFKAAKFFNGRGNEELANKLLDKKR